MWSGIWCPCTFCCCTCFRLQARHKENLLVSKDTSRSTWITFTFHTSYHQMPWLLLFLFLLSWLPTQFYSLPLLTFYFFLLLPSTHTSNHYHYDHYHYYHHHHTEYTLLTSLYLPYTISTWADNFNFLLTSFFPSPRFTFHLQTLTSFFLCPWFCEFAGTCITFLIHSLD